MRDVYMVLAGYAYRMHCGFDPATALRFQQTGEYHGGLVFFTTETLSRPSYFRF